jgi:non-ribosomal peptide synthase protein (TIGR01720 family)
LTRPRWSFHYNALRLRVSGESVLLIPAEGSVRASSCLQRISLAGLDDMQRREALRRAFQDGMSRLDPHAGVLLQAVWAEAEPRQPGKLLLIIHHLAIDGVSWRILVPDLAAACNAAIDGRAITLPSKTTSFRRWVENLVASAPQRRRELPFWNEMASKIAPALVADALDPAHTIGSAINVERALSNEATAAVLTTVPAAFHARINDVLLTALVLATAAWRGARGDTDSLALRVDLESHGREPFDPSIDLARTVGWFTTLYPLHLDPGAIDLPDALAGGPAAGRALKRIKEQLRTVPNNGIGYSMLRYLDPGSAAELDRHPAPQIVFNYLGRFPVGDGTDWQPTQDGVFIAHADSAFPLDHPIAVNAITYDTPAGPILHANWTFAPALVSEAEANRLADTWSNALEALARRAAQPGAGGLTPSDLDLVELEQKEIEVFERQYPDLEEIWPLALLQEGLLFHARYQSDGEDPYLVQLVFELDGTLDSTRLRRALDALLERHPNLRVHFHLNRSGRPLQIVHAHCAMPWREHDLSALEPSERDRLATETEAEDRCTRFVLEKAPLIRATLLHLGPDRHRLLLTQHHLLSDGWSSSILLQDLSALYRHQGDTGALPRQPAFRNYLVWLQHQDKQAARDAWRSYLAGVEAPTRLGPSVAEDAPAVQAQFEEHLSAEFTARLETLARQHSLTLAIVLQGAWSILLARLTNQNGVVYGHVSSGRQALVPGIERIFGLLITTTPARAQLHPTESAVAFLERLQREQAALLPHQHLPLSEIHKLAGEQVLFDTLFTYENYPVEPPNAPSTAEDLPLREIRGHNSNHYPLSLAVIPGDGLSLRFHYGEDLFDRASTEQLATRLVRLLEQIANDPSQPLHRLQILGPEEQRQIICDFNDTAAPLPQAALVDLFERQVSKTPDNVALLFEDRQCTYAELDARANQLAWKLIADGIGPEDIVAICLERSLAMIVAILATLKAGAAYLPLDP